MKNGLVLSACAVVTLAFSGCGTDLVELWREWQTGGGECAISCAAPPPGCHYKGAVTSGPCGSLTCGELVCEGDGGVGDGGTAECLADCSTPPPGCRYDGDSCCRGLICDTDGGEPHCAVGCAPPPPDCHVEGQILEGPCSEVTCGRVVCLP